jgi:hypothetical protein
MDEPIISDKSWQEYREHFYPVKITNGNKIVDRGRSFTNAMKRIERRNQALIVLGFEPKKYTLEIENPAP